MAGVKGVVGALGALGKAADAVVLAQGVEAVLAPGEELMGIGLVAHVPDDLVLGGVKDVMQGDGEFHHPQAGGEVPAGHGDRGDDLVANLPGQLRQELRGDLLQVHRTADSA